MAEVRKAYLELRATAQQNSIGVLELVKLFEIEIGQKFDIPDSRLLNHGWVEFQNNKLVLTTKGEQFLALIDNKATIKDQFIPLITPMSGKFIKTIAKELFKDKYTEEVAKKMTQYIKNPLLSPFFFLFLEIFPTADPKKNKDWERLFNSEYQGVTLRKATEGTAKKFEKIARTKDIGIFLAGAYQHILQSYNSNNKQYYPKALENFFREWEYWYDNAELTFKKKGEKLNTNNMTIV